MWHHEKTSNILKTVTWQDMVTENFLKSFVTTFNPQEHAKNSYIKLHARVSYTS